MIERRIFTNNIDKLRLLFLARKYNIGLLLEHESDILVFTVNGWKQNIDKFLSKIEIRRPTLPLDFN